VNLDACGAPRRCQVVGVVDEEVRRAGAAVVARHDSEVDLNAVAGGEAVAASCIRADGEAESLVVPHRSIEVMDGEDGCYPLHGAHGVSLA